MKVAVFLILCASMLFLAGACSNVLQLAFREVFNNTVYDSSLNSNDGHALGCLQLNMGQRATREMGCAPYVRMNSGYITLSGNHFRGKPLHGVTMATWVKLSSLSGDHSIFCTIGGRASTHTWGQYHFEVNNGRVRWFHRNEKKKTVFSVNTGKLVQANKWTHIAGTYDAGTGTARVYLNGKLISQKKGSGTLSQDWEKFAGIGRLGKYNSRILGGYLDEFNMYDCALSAQAIARLYSMCKV